MTHQLIERIEEEESWGRNVEPGKLIACGLRMLGRRAARWWKRLANEAHRDTYGLCPHPPAMTIRLEKPLHGNYETTVQCGCCDSFAEIYSVNGWYKIGPNGEKIYEDAAS